MRLLSALAETHRVLAALPRVEHLRRTLGPERALAELRRNAPTAENREALVRAIRIIDAARKPNCYRRALLRVALDRDTPPVHFGFSLEGERVRGHAWIEGEPPTDQWDLVIDL